MWRRLQSWCFSFTRPSGSNELEDGRHQLVATIVKDDGSERAAFYRRLDGAFEYELQRHYVIDGLEGRDLREYWAVFTASGLFDSGETAKRDAAAVATWVSKSASR